MSAQSPKTAAAKTKKPAKVSEHPPVSEMVKSAITSLADKKGSSLAAIKKYVQSNYKGIDMVKLAPFIRRFLKKAVTDGVLVTAQGHAGSFKLGEKAKRAPKVEKKQKKVTKPKAVKPKKDAKPKKVKTPKKDAKPKKAKTPKKDVKPKSKKEVKPKTKKAKTPTKKAATKKPTAAKPKKPNTPKKTTKSAKK